MISRVGQRRKRPEIADTAGHSPIQSGQAGPNEVSTVVSGVPEPALLGLACAQCSEVVENDKHQ